jgi:DNA-binding response OmpR family regulator
VLRDAGFDVRVTQTAEDALAQGMLRVPDAVILEMTLVDSTGTAVCQRLREWSSVPIIILASVADKDRVVDAFRAAQTITSSSRSGPASSSLAFARICGAPE